MFCADAPRASFVAIAMISGFSCLRCDLAAIVTGVSVIPYDNLDMVFPVQGAISIISVRALGPIGSASLMVLMIFCYVLVMPR